MNKAKERRLHFGIVLPSLDNTQKYSLLQGIENYAKEYDIHLTAYFGTYEARSFNVASSPHYEPCFEAIRRNTALDGIIIFSSFIAHNIGKDAFVTYISSISEHIPIVSIGLQIQGAYCVMVDNASGMYNAVNHLIQSHGKKRIAMIKGPDGHPEAEARFSGYLKALSDNDIARDDNLILPGYFTPQSGLKAVEELLDLRKVSFDAISACDDDSALAALRALTERGMSIPDDIAVTGFNDIEDAKNAEPALSTIRLNFSEFGVIAIDALRRIVRGENTDAVISVIPDFLIRSSCGCNKNENFKMPPPYREFHSEHRRQMVTDHLLLQFNLESLGNALHESLPVVSIDFAIVGVYRNTIKESTAGSDRSIGVLFGFDGENGVVFNNFEKSKFPLSDCSAIKNVDFERERRTLFFLPLFFDDEESGAAIIAYDSLNPMNWYEALRRNIAAAVKGASLLETIQKLSVTDELTGLLNRRGFFGQVYTRIIYLQRATDKHHPTVFAIDMDGLKFINDTYGHIEGDCAISVFAQLLQDSVRKEDIVGRIGGDEFVVFSVVKTENDICILESRIRKKLEEYNKKENHPYNLSGSIGTALLRELTNAAFDQAIIEADDAMYKEKQEKKKKGLSRG